MISCPSLVGRAEEPLPEVKLQQVAVAGVTPSAWGDDFTSWCQQAHAPEAEPLC